MLACPLEPVGAVLGEKLPPRPPSEKLIGAPDTAPPEEFFAFTTIGCGSVVPTAPDCFPPETCEMLETLGVEVSVKVADVYSELLAVMVMVSTEAGNV